MTYRKTPFVAGEYFHLVNRGNLKCDIFKDDLDRARFLLYILHLQSARSINNIGSHAKKFIKENNFGFNHQDIETLIENRLVTLIAFCLMPNHFHLIVQSNVDNGVSTYMQKILNGYTKYFNTRYQQSGHLFQGPFRAVHIKDNEQLLYASAYVHLNAREIDYNNRETEYRWSSFSDYTNENRWGELLKPKIIMDQMDGPNPGQSYKKWVETSGAKEDYQTPGV
ncbi:MAG: transposase [Candidatus Paceibacterota bacterium]